MSDIPNFSSFDFYPVMNYPDDLYLIDLSEDYDPEFIRSKEWGVSRYNEKRRNMYKAPQYEGERNIHMGVDIWASADSSVYAFFDGKVVYLEDLNEEGNYGPTIVTKHLLGSYTLFALHGHLSRSSLEIVERDQPIKKGQKIAELGREEVNGGWAPHLHFQLSKGDPGSADMPGVVSDAGRVAALELYPDPRLVLGHVY